MTLSAPARWPGIGGFALLAALLLAGCEPCAGVTVCGAPRLDYEGDVYLHLNGRPAAGVRVELQRTGGVRLEHDTLVAVTDSAGRFRLAAEADGEGTVSGRIVFAPAPPYEKFPFAVEVELGTVRAAGDVRFLGSWGVGPVRVQPRVRAVGELYHRGTLEPAEGVPVEFRRTGGVDLDRPVLTVASGSDGRFHLVAPAVGASRGSVEGELTVRPAAPASPFTLAGIRLAVATIESDVQFLGRWGVGAGLFYQGELNWVDTYTHAPGFEVEFRRTGGIAVEPDTFTVVTGTDGRFTLRPRTAEVGEVVADLRVRHPDPAKSFVIPGVRLATREADEPQLIGVWTVERP